MKNSKEKCSFCGASTGAFVGHGLRVHLDNDDERELVIDSFGHDGDCVNEIIRMRINNCPMCGRVLKGDIWNGLSDIQEHIK